MALKANEQFVADLIESWGGLDEVTEVIDAIIEYRETDFYESKNDMLGRWEIDHNGIYELVICIFTVTLINDYLTMQAAVGAMNHKIKLDDELERIKIIADVIGLVVNTGLINMISIKGEYHTLVPGYDVTEAIPREDKHITITSRPQPVEGNYDRAGGTGSVILGHSMNHHSMDVRLSHLQRMGQIPFKINADFVNQYEEAPKNDPVTDEQIAQWEDFRDESLAKYEELIKGDQKFYIRHKYDSRGRSYSGSYHLNPQGHSFKKAVVQLANKEIVEGD